MITGALEIDLDTFAARLRDGAFVIDVREPHEYVAGHVPGARLVPLGTLPTRLRDLPRDRTVHVICAGGNRSLSAVRSLGGTGVRAVSVAGGTSAWIGSGRPAVKGSSAA